MVCARPRPSARPSRDPLPARLGVVVLAAAAVAVTAGSCTPKPLNERPEPGAQLYMSPQVNPVALSCDGALAYVANTTSGTLSIVDTAAREELAQVQVGEDPVGVAVRPKADCGDPEEDELVFVTNHVSDSIAVVSRTARAVVQLVQELDGDGVALTDEPVGVAFDGPDAAFVTLDHPNQIVKLTPDAQGVWGIAAATPLAPAGAASPPADAFTAQAPRALAVAGGRVYVAAFESGNQSEFPSCGAGDPVTYDPGGHGGEGTGCEFPLDTTTLLSFATSPNIGGEVVHNDAIPDRDLFVYDTDLNLLETVEGLGTLLYGVAASGSDVFVTSTDARNKLDGLDALGGRMFENRLAILSCGGTCSLTGNVDLDANGAGVPVPTPYGVAVSGDGQTLVASVAGSDGLPGLPGDPGTDIPGLVVLDASGSLLGHVQTGAIPQGLALASDGGGAAQTAWVLNTVESTLSVVDVSTPGAPAVVDTIAVGSDPTPAAVRSGRIQFASARASTNGTFSCESCHPSGNIDQVDWTINTDVGPEDSCGGSTVCAEPRSTMPIRGLRDTLPLHWAGNLADPFSGAGVGGPEDPQAPDCDLGSDGETGCIRHLVDASLSGVMCDPASCPQGPSGLPGALSDGERDDMAAFLAAVSFPPPPQRRPDDALSPAARDGVRDFFTDQGGLGAALGGVRTCADADGGCHALPLTVSTNSPVVGGFDAPSIRGLWDRTITFSNGITSSRAHLASQGFDPQAAGMSELGSLAATFPGLFTLAYNVPVDGIWAYINEMSVGLPGLSGHQVLLTEDNATDPDVGGRLAAVEAAAAEGRITAVATLANLEWRYAEGSWLPERGAGLTTAELRGLPTSSGAPVMVTARLPGNVQIGGAARQPLLWVGGAPSLPTLNAGASNAQLTLSASYVEADATVLVDGAACAGCSLSLGSGSVDVTLDAVPADPGVHVLQVLNPEGYASNELPLCVESTPDC